MILSSADFVTVALTLRDLFVRRPGPVAAPETLRHIVAASAAAFAGSLA